MKKNVEVAGSLPTGASCSVLVVDDDEFSCELFSEMLAAHGVAEIRTASNGQLALRTLAAMACAPDFLICDIFMPDMDGIEFLDHLAKQRYQGGILLVSGMNIEMLAIAREVAISDGLKVLGAFTKPVRHEVLAQALGLARAD